MCGEEGGIGREGRGGRRGYTSCVCVGGGGGENSNSKTSILKVYLDLSNIYQHSHPHPYYSAGCCSRMFVDSETGNVQLMKRLSQGASPTG